MKSLDKKRSKKKVIIAIILVIISIITITIMYALFNATKVLQLTADDGTVYQVNLSNLDKGIAQLEKEWSIENKYGIIYRDGTAKECLALTYKDSTQYYVHCIDLETGTVKSLDVYENKSNGIEYALNQGAISMTSNYYIESFTIITYGEPRHNTTQEQTNSKLTKEVNEIVDNLKQVNAYNLIDKSTVTMSINNIEIRQNSLGKIAYYRNMTGKYIPEDFSIIGENNIYKPLEYEPILYMNKEGKKLLAVRATNAVIRKLEVYYQEANIDKTLSTKMDAYINKEAIILYDITSIYPNEIEKLYKIKISDTRGNLAMNEKIIEVGYSQGSFPESYLNDFYNVNGENLFNLTNTMFDINSEDIQQFDPEGKYTYSNLTGIEQAIEDGMLGKECLTDGISKETLSFLCSDGNLQMYYDSFEKCLEDARKLNILREATEEELQRLESMP